MQNGGMIPVTAPFGDLLRVWRQRRRLSQLELSSQADISTRHLSFVETGRARPSRDMVVRIAEHLEIPLRDRNQMLLVAGYAPVYSENDYGSRELAGARQAVCDVLAAHEPYPALAVDRLWNVLDANAAVPLLTQVASPSLLAAEPLNALRLSLHPDGLAPHIVNLGQWRAAVLGGLLRAAQARADADMLALHDELAAYPCDDPTELSIPDSAVHVPFKLRIDDCELSFLAIIASFGTPLDITLSELAIESFFPADPQTAAYLRERAG